MKQGIYITILAFLIAVIYGLTGWTIAYVLDRAFFIDVSYTAFVSVCLAIWALIMFAVYMNYRREEKNESSSS